MKRIIEVLTLRASVDDENWECFFVVVYAFIISGLFVGGVISAAVVLGS